jgi:hypothetical protein
MKKKRVTAKKQTRVKSARFEQVSGVPCVVIVCDNGTEVLCPAEAFLVLAPKARHFLNSTKTELRTGEWVSAQYQPVDQIVTGTTDDGRVALQFDPGTDFEICLSLDPQIARDL